MARVSKWGNSLALRLPVAMVESLALKEGDEVVLTPNPDGSLNVARDRRRAEALEAIGRLARPMPPGFRFDREEASRRGGED